MENTTPAIAVRASKPTVQHEMNVAVGQIRWYSSNDGSQDLRWTNLLTARAQFVTGQLAKDNLTMEQFVALKSLDRQNQVAKMARAFTEEFFQYTRDNDWMQEAVGEISDWLNIPGMSEWHVKAAIHSLKRKYTDPLIHRSIGTVSYLIIVYLKSDSDIINQVIFLQRGMSCYYLMQVSKVKIQELGVLLPPFDSKPRQFSSP